jgi:hypothetical protein
LQARQLLVSQNWVFSTTVIVAKTPVKCKNLAQGRARFLS